MPVPQAVVAALHHQLQLLLALGQRLAQPPLAPQRPVRPQDRRHQQQGRHHRAAGGQQPRHPARRLPKVFRKGPFQRGQPRIDLGDPAQHGRHAIVVAARPFDQPAQCQRLLVQRGDLLVAGGPHANRGINLVDMAEIAVQPDHPRDIVRVVAAGEQSFAHALEVRLAAVEFQPGALVPQRDGNGSEIESEIFGVAVLAIAQQMRTAR